MIHTKGIVIASSDNGNGEKAVKNYSKNQKEKGKSEKNNGKMYPEHHRKPTSIGGSNKKVNKSRVYYERHHAWHDIAGNMNALQIAGELNKFMKHCVKFFVYSRKNENLFLIPKQNGNCDCCKDKKRKKKAWKILFGKRPSNEIVKEINNIWLDPDFYFKIHKHY